MKTNQTPSEVEEKIDEILAELYHGNKEYATYPKSDAQVNARNQITALIEQAKVEARLDELYEAVDVQVKHLPMYLISRIETLTTKESEVNNE